LVFTLIPGVGTAKKPECDRKRTACRDEARSGWEACERRLDEAVVGKNAAERRAREACEREEAAGGLPSPDPQTKHPTAEENMNPT
jgi:hypothetical protein